MPEFQLLRCMVALGGDEGNTVYRHRGTPILFHELIVLQSLHGEEAISEVYIVGVCDMSQEEAMQRLRTIYKPEVITELFPGARPRLPTGDGSLPLCNLPIHVLKPTEPDSPDPKLRPLDGYTLTGPRVYVDTPATEDEPTAEEIAAHAQDDDEDIGLDLLDPQPSRPTVDDLVQKRVAYRGGASQAKRTPDHLPDIVHVPKSSNKSDQNRPRG
jgi:hypothetical protein